jgi:SAM-dependent methyltransferase
MSHPEQVGFFEVVAKANAELIEGAKVLEIGSYDVNGGIRHLFRGAGDYVGVDLDHGPGVDRVGFGHEVDDPDQTYDVTLSGECFEHDQHWHETFLNMVRLTRPGGLVAFTCAARGRAEHGTGRTDAISSPGTQAIGLDYYRNVNEEDFADIPLGDFFSEYRFWYLNTHFDLFFAGVRAGEGSPRAALPGDVDVESLRGLMSRPHQALLFPFRRLSAVLPEDRYQKYTLSVWHKLLPLVQWFENRRETASASSATLSDDRGH